MNKILWIVAMAFMSLTTIKAQEQTRVHEQIYRSSFKVAANKSEDTNVRKIASFKVDAISYLKSKTLERITDDTNTLKAEEIKSLNNRLDSMAYFMYDFVNLFTKEYTKAATAKDQAWIMKIFRDASLNHPLYKDEDKELVLSYVNNSGYLTQFSLDTNWVDALAEAKGKLRQK